MKDLHSRGLKVEKDQLYLLDQTQLPNKEEWVCVKDTFHMVELIKCLSVRGAPLIGVSAALALAQSAHRGTPREKLLEEADLLRKARPTAVNLMWAIDKLKKFISDEGNYSVEKLIDLSQNIFQEDVDLCLKMAVNAQHLINEGDNILTHCNTGGLATAGIGTALGVIQVAWEQGKRIHVYVDETRPLLQGGRLTTYELEKLGIPFTLICDNMAATLMREKKIQKVFLGADRVAMNGDFANKIGTLSVASLAHLYDVPFYPVAPYTTLDPQCPDGASIPIEQRNPEEVQGFAGPAHKFLWASPSCPVFNPAFDVTPVEYISGLVTDQGYFSQDEIKLGKLKECLK